MAAESITNKLSCIRSEDENAFIFVLSYKRYLTPNWLFAQPILAGESREDLEDIHPVRPIFPQKTYTVRGVVFLSPFRYFPSGSTVHQKGERNRDAWGISSNVEHQMDTDVLMQSAVFE